MVDAVENVVAEEVGAEMVVLSLRMHLKVPMLRLLALLLVPSLSTHSLLLTLVPPILLTTLLLKLTLLSLLLRQHPWLQGRGRIPSNQKCATLLPVLLLL